MESLLIALALIAVPVALTLVLRYEKVHANDNFKPLY